MKGGEGFGNEEVGNSSFFYLLEGFLRVSELLGLQIFAQKCGKDEDRSSAA